MTTNSDSDFDYEQTTTTSNTTTTPSEPKPLQSCSSSSSTSSSSSDDDDDDELYAKSLVGGISARKDEKLLVLLDDDDDDDDGGHMESHHKDVLYLENSIHLLHLHNSLGNTSKPNAATSSTVSLNDISERSKTVTKLLQKQVKNGCKLSGERLGDASLETFWFEADSYNLNAFNEVNGFWPIGHPLPLASWSNESKPTLKFDSVWEFEDLNAIIETKLQHILEDTHYDTINIFTTFYKTFKRTRRSNLKSFFQFYDIPINRRHHMCASLAFEMIAKLIEVLPEMQYYLYVVSCEEQVNQRDYITGLEEVGLHTANANYMYEKEHVMVAIKIAIDGRDGIILLDPGYHIARPVIVMKDQLYPHTGWFTQSKENNLQRDYCYNLSGYSHKYVEWHERETRGESVTHKCSVVYIEKPYVTAIDVTVRRNLAYNFRSLVSRDAKGNLLAGIYLPVLPNSNDAYFTLFYNGSNGQRIKTKFMLNVFKNIKNIPDHVMQHLNKLAPQLKISLSNLLEIGQSLFEALTDEDFLNQLISINEDINNIGCLGPDN